MNHLAPKGATGLARVAEIVTPKRILDLGANVGAWSKEAKKLWPDAFILLVEGNPECDDMLRESGFPYLIELLSDREKDVTFFTRRDAPTCTGASIYREGTEFYSGVNAVPNIRRAIPLTDIFPNGKPDRPFDLCKLDCQGSELDIMRGGKEIVRAAEAVIVEVSLEEYNKGAPMAEQVIDFMHDEIGFSKHEEIGKITHPLDSSRHIQSDLVFYA